MPIARPGPSPLLILLPGLFALGCSAPPPDAPEYQGPPPAEVQRGTVDLALWGDELVGKIDSLAEATLADGMVASLAIGVKHGDDLLMAKGYGMADLENAVPAKAETVYRIGSITKQFTSAAIMQLFEEGKIGLDDSMTRYLPDFPTQGHEVTIRHLLTHTSGIQSYTGMEGWSANQVFDLTEEEQIDLFKNEPFNFAPGEEFLYNNSGYFLLGVIIGKVSGEGYRGYLKTHLFEPLGLTGSSYCDEGPLIPWRAEGYEVVDGEILNDRYLSMNLPGAAGALCSTVPDLLAWTEALTSGQVVSPASFAQMITPFTLNDGSQTGYGFGLGVGDVDGNPVVSHGGGINGFVTSLADFPAADLHVVVLSNTPGRHPGQVMQTIAGWALGLEASEGSGN